MGDLDISATRKQDKREECGKKIRAQKQDQDIHVRFWNIQEVIMTDLLSLTKSKIKKGHTMLTLKCDSTVSGVSMVLLHSRKICQPGILVIHFFLFVSYHLALTFMVIIV